MKAILEFDLENPDDIIAHKRCTSAHDMVMMLWHYDNWLRSQIKHNHDISDGERKAYDEAREMLYEKMNEKGVVLDML